MRNLVFAFFLVAPLPVYAGSLHCRADYDESSHYELTAQVSGETIQGAVGFRYVTSDNIDLHADLSPKQQRVEPGKGISFEAANDSMSVKLETVFEKAGYKGPLEVSFSLDHAEPLTLDAVCALD